MNTMELSSALEAVLFACGEPLSVERICAIFVATEEEVTKAANMLIERLQSEKSGLKVIKLNDKYQICTKEEYGDYIKAALDLRRKTPLSAAAFEVLATIAYNQPVTKAFVEQVRGVDCSGVITSLADKQLIEEKGRLELPGHPILYGTTDNFLRCFGISELSELPPLPKDKPGDNEDLAEQISLSVEENEISE